MSFRRSRWSGPLSQTLDTPAVAACDLVKLVGCVVVTARSRRDGTRQATVAESSSSDAATATSRERRESPTSGRPAALPGRFHPALGLLLRRHVAKGDVCQVQANMKPESRYSPPSRTNSNSEWISRTAADPEFSNGRITGSGTGWIRVFRLFGCAGPQQIEAPHCEKQVQQKMKLETK